MQRPTSACCGSWRLRATWMQRLVRAAQAPAHAAVNSGNALAACMVCTPASVLPHPTPCTHPPAGGGSREDQHGAVVKLAWGVLLSQYGPESAAGQLGVLRRCGLLRGCCGGRLHLGQCGSLRVCGCGGVAWRPAPASVTISVRLTCRRFGSCCALQNARASWWLRPQRRGRWRSCRRACWTACPCRWGLMVASAGAGQGPCLLRHNYVGAA